MHKLERESDSRRAQSSRDGAQRRSAARVIFPLKAGFPLGEFVRANGERSNLIGWRQTLTTSPANHIRFLLVRANKFAKWKTGLRPLFHSWQKPTRKLAASAFKYCDWMKVLAASLRVFCDEWKRAFRYNASRLHVQYLIYSITYKLSFFHMFFI